MKILLQFPEGLKSKAVEYAERLQKQGHTVYLSGSKSYGGCDIAFEEADTIGAKKIIHFGHSRFPFSNIFKEKYRHIEIEYVEHNISVDLNLINRLIEHLNKNKLKRPILATTAQHAHQIDKFIKILEEGKLHPTVGRGIKTVHKAQILGCDVSSVSSVRDKGDCVVYIGGGKFHYLILNVGLPVISINPYSNEIRDVTEEIKKYEKQRQGQISRASEGQNFGILVSTRAGQFNLNIAHEIKRRLEEKGKNAEIIISREIDKEALQDFNVFDAYINTACPRISDDWKLIGKPIINPNELKLLFETFV